jgi:serine/threonine protein kinase
VTGFGYHTLLSKNVVSQFDKYFHPAEKFSNGEVFGPLTDIWSLGCITYFMLSGKGLTNCGAD